MTWTKTTADRQRDARVYGPGYQRNQEAVRRRAGGRCESCGHRHRKLQCDHIVPASQGGGPEVSNLTMLCVGEGSCKCHERKTATEGGGFRSGKRKAADPPCKPRTAWLRRSVRIGLEVPPTSPTRAPLALFLRPRRETVKR